MELTNDQLNFLAESTPGNRAIYQIKDGRIVALYVSPSLHSIIGMDEDEFNRIAGYDASDIVFPADLPALKAALDDCIRTREPMDRYWRIPHPEQGFAWVHGNATYCGELDGCPVLFVVYGTDFNEIDLYKDVVDSSQTMVYVCDCATYEILYANKAAREYGGNADTAPLGRTCYSYIHDRPSPCEDCFMKTLEHGRSLSRDRFNSRHGTWEHLSGNYISWCGHDAFIQYLQDITELKVSEQKLENSEKRFSTAIEGAHLGVWEYRVKDRTIIGGNDAFTENNLPSCIENVPESLIPCLGEENRAKLENMYRLIDEGETEVQERFWWKPYPDRPPICEQTYYTVTKDAEGRPDVAYGISMNITAQMQEQRRFGQAIQSLLTANPESLCTFQLNLSQNKVIDGHGTSESVLNSLQSDTVDGMLGNAASLIVDPEQRAQFAQTFSRKDLLQAYDSGTSSLAYDYRRKGENGHSIWVRTYGNLLKEPENDNIIAIIYSLDITHEVLNEEAVRIITNQAFDYAMVMHLDSSTFNLLTVNEFLRAEFGEEFGVADEVFDYRTLREMALKKLAEPNDRPLYEELSSVQHIRQEMERNGSYEFETPVVFDSAPDQVRYRKFQHFYLSKDDETVLCLGSDITESVLQKRKEADLAKSEAEKVTDILDSITAGIGVLHMTDPDHLSYEYVNQQMYNMLGFDRFGNDIAQDASIWDTTIKAYLDDGFSGVHPDDLERVKKTFHDNYDSSEFTVDTYRTQGGDGKYYWLKQDVRLREITPTCHVFYSVYRNVEKEVLLQRERQRQLEAERSLRRQADVANAAKSEFLSRMSHDMRTPLNVILGITHLSSEREHTAQTADELSKIDTSSRFLLGLINDVLDMTKAESGKMTLHIEPYAFDDFSEYMEAFARPLCEERGLKLVYDVQPVKDYVPLMDKLRTNQLLFNLLSNAAKFTPEGGTVTVSVHWRMTATGKLAIDAFVSDTGIGMSEDFQKVLFEPFSQERRNDVSLERGTGLGLSISKRIAEMMGAAIKVESAVGKGTKFTIRGEFDCIPVDELQARETPESAADDSMLAGKHVLLCEDHPLNQEIAKTLLQERSVFVDIAGNGQVGVDMFKQSAPGSYDAVLMDIRMPVMDGYEATAALRALNRSDAQSVPIIAMTADAFADDVQKCLDAGMNGHIAKPIDPALMYRTLESAIAKATGSEGE